MPLTTTATALLLTVGAVLALFGVAGFLGNWCGQAPDHDSLRYVQALATGGRRAITAGIALHTTTRGIPTGPLLTVLLCAAVLASATYLTSTTNTIIPTGATP